METNDLIKGKSDFNQWWWVWESLAFRGFVVGSLAGFADVLSGRIGYDNIGMSE
jgi:hypothetical protein